MLSYIIIATLLVGLTSFVSIILFLKRNPATKLIKLVISLAAGALLGAVFFSILPELFSQEHTGTEFLSTYSLSVIILISIMAFFLLEKYFHWHHCQCDHPEHEHNKKPMGYINLVGDGIHNFVDGTLIASSFLISPTFGIITTLAIIAHEIPQEISDMGILIYSGFTKIKALFWNFISALTSVMGGIIAYFLASSIHNLVSILLALAAGSFLYLAMADIMPELHHEKDLKQMTKQFIFLIIGLLIIFLVTKLVPHGH